MSMKDNFRGEWSVGQRIWLEFDFDRDGAAIDPTTPGVIVTEPDGTSTTLVHGVDAAVEKLSTGRYRASWLIAQNGRHWYAPISTAAGQEAVEEFYFTGLARRTG